MTNFVLVHGAWQSAWSWHRVIEELEVARESLDVGRVLAPDLPGHGQRVADEIRRITIDHYINAVATEVQVERLEDVVLVGHGFSGTFLPQVAQQLGDKVKGVVFLAGDLPPEGTSPYDRLPLRDKMILWVTKAHEKGFRYPDFISRAKLCNGLDRITCRELLARLVPEPLVPWKTPAPRKEFVGKPHVTYALLTRDRLIEVPWQRRYISSLGSHRVEELDAGHSAPLSHPREVAEILLRCG